ncbi:hypothetical protein SNOG_08555 [Parastagonospora nodorum SN15]|uniref:Clr5 domain-containing protein n=1 Tax=Phaeosphaeria nodorum (strain SN15 / ATCC MYA-4574 / FGSC 10173) TaxID=321614 RepID=Q0UI59_PHANO|nr:hypothetical protein SNOG_08555 [Parastagonospora nodorum SN15]EAT83723.2 hypothetical protein SNOG_08555 [Parastagonospora nodorum SN15]
MDYMPSNEVMMSPTSMQPPPRPRKKAPTLRDADWDPHQVLITELYTSGKTLKDVIAIVKAETGFHAEDRQYKSRISKWNLDKNTKTKEMKSIVKKRQKRKIIEDDKAELMFSVRGNELDSTKIDRWMREHNVDEDELYSPSSLVSLLTHDSYPVSSQMSHQHPAQHSDHAELDSNNNYKRHFGAIAISSSV